jgi:hypothetical protein
MSFIDTLYAQYQEELADEMFSGDARRCPRHPHVQTSSPDGLFDTCCPECEAEMAMEPDDQPHTDDAMFTCPDCAATMLDWQRDGHVCIARDDFEDDRRGAAFLHDDIADDIEF